MCISKWFRKNASPKKAAVPRGEANKSVTVNKAVNPLTEMRHQAATGDPKLKGRHHTGSF